MGMLRTKEAVVPYNRGIPFSGERAIRESGILMHSKLRKAYAHLPLDSADVWSNPRLFRLKERVDPVVGQLDLACIQRICNYRTQ